MAITGRRDGNGNGGGRRINVREAQVHTMQASTRVLTIHDKQVTLAVFRQLWLEDVIDGATLTFRGLPWGTVNYHPDADCRKSVRYHHHVVWQKGQELRRATVYRGGLSESSELYHKTRDRIPRLERVVRALTLLRGEGRATEPMSKAIREGNGEDQGSYHISGHEHYYSAPTADECLNELACWPLVYEPLYPQYADQSEPVPYTYDTRGRERDAQYKHRMAYEQCVARAQKIVGDWTEETVLEEIERLEGIQRRLEEAWAQRWAEIEALDQLFIAV